MIDLCVGVLLILFALYSILFKRGTVFDLMGGIFLLVSGIYMALPREYFRSYLKKIKFFSPINGVYPLMGITLGVFLSFLGSYFLFHRKKIAGAFIASNKVFWERMGFPQRGGEGLTDVMIPVFGILFTIGGVTLLLEMIISLYTKYRS